MFAITVARAGDGTTNYKNMKTRSKEITLQEALNLAAEDTARERFKKNQHFADQDVERENAGKEVGRIFENLMERTSAILLALGIEMAQAHILAGPIGDTSGLAEKLSQIEIIPEVKTNALTTDK
jgi:hypothetical protein